MIAGLVRLGAIAFPLLRPLAIAAVAHAGQKFLVLRLLLRVELLHDPGMHLIKGRRCVAPQPDEVLAGGRDNRTDLLLLGGRKRQRLIEDAHLRRRKLFGEHPALDESRRHADGDQAASHASGEEDDRKG